MPYYDIGRHEEVVETILPVANIPTKGNLLRRASFERGFRTVVPSGTRVVEIALNIAEPYSWFMDYMNMRKRTAKELGTFDSSGLKDDRGHTWDFEQLEVVCDPWDFTMKNGTGPVGSFHTMYPRITNGTVDSTVCSLPATGLESWTALQYGRMAPVVSEFSLSTFLGELREGLPRVLSDAFAKANTLKGLGSDYLNLEFGWKPMLNDLQNLAEGLLSASFGLYRPLGATHRRREAKPIENFSRWDSVGENVSAAAGNWCSFTRFPYSGTSWVASTGARAGFSSVVTKTTIKRWAEGEFVYIPKAGFDPNRYLDRLETLMTFDITPSVLWELSPWSWLVDWAGQIGQSIASMEAATNNRIMSSYFYGMEDITASQSVSVNSLSSFSSFVYNGPRRVSGKIERRRRRRIRGNPFGFSGNPSTALNGDQMAILGALGLTKIR